MNIEEIKQVVSIKDIMNMYGIRLSNGRCSCPIHKGNNSTAFIVNEESNMWYCYTGSCGFGDIFEFVSKIENISFYESAKLIADKFNISFSSQNNTQPSKLIKENKQWLNKMSKRTKQHEHKEFDLTTLGDLYEINSYRQFDKSILNKFNIKYCNNNKRIVVPIYQNNICIGVTMRRTNNHPAKWIHQPDDIKTGNLLYNIDNINKDNVIITEGVIDTLTYDMYGYNAICSFGAHLSEQQERLLLQNTYNVILSYDMDKAGIEITNKLIERLRYKVNLSIANIPLGKDPNELSVYEVHNAIQNKLSIKEWSEKCGKNN